MAAIGATSPSAHLAPNDRFPSPQQSFVAAVVVFRSWTQFGHCWASASECSVLLASGPRHERTDELTHGPQLPRGTDRQQLWDRRDDRQRDRQRADIGPDAP